MSFDCIFSAAVVFLHLYCNISYFHYTINIALLSQRLLVETELNKRHFYLNYFENKKFTNFRPHIDIFSLHFRISNVLPHNIYTVFIISFTLETFIY